ncbi:MAG: putative transporter [Dactylosporangium sp.]|nr:putative transporter [Dactylosporangium sp.]
MTTQGDPALVRTGRPEPAGEPTATTLEARTDNQAEPTASASTSAVAGGVDRLVAALTDLRDTVAGVRYPLALPEAEQTTRAAAAIRDQLDDYLLPRLGRLDAPLLVVVGGSTGAGKSTLVNSLVRVPVSAAGVLRPTTRAPVLVCHPDDAPWFSEARLLPGLARTTNRPTGTDSLQVISAQGLTPGLAFLDAPDIDSVVDANRALAVQLLAAADLWLFVTTAARYADAVPWELLRSARSRGTAVALVLDRVPPGAADAIGPHLTGMLRANDLGAAPLFVLPEVRLEAQGLLADRIVAPLRDWFAALAKSSAARAAVVRQTVGGAIAALGPAVEQFAEAADAQVNAADILAAGVSTAYRDAGRSVEQGIRDGVLLRGEVLARWQELVGTGELMRGLQARVGRLRDRMAAAVTGQSDPGERLQAALGSGVVALIRNAAADAAERVVAAWRVHPAGAALLETAGLSQRVERSETAAAVDLTAPSADLSERTARLVRDWQRGVLELVRTEAGDKRAFARASAFAVNATGLLVMVSVFVATSFIPTGVEIAVAGGTTVAAQKVLEAIFGDQAIRNLADKARQDLSARIHELLAEEAGRFLSVLDNAGVDATAADRLRRTAASAEAARAAAPLTGGTGLPQPTLDGVQP